MRAIGIVGLFLLAACSHAPREVLPGSLPGSTLLALSPDGKQLLVARPEGTDTVRGRLLGLASGGVISARDVPLPKGTLTMAWSRSPAHVLLTTHSPEQGGELLRVDLSTGARQVVHASSSMLRFPIETQPGVHAVLEARTPGDRYSQWQRISPQGKTLLHEKIYSLAAPLEQVQGSLHLLEPTRQFRVFEGQLPQQMRGMVTDTTWTLHCADKLPLTCVRTQVFLPKAGGSYGTIEILRGTQRCAVGERWIDAREVQISPDGSTVAFHGSPERGAPRAVYAVDTSTCRTFTAFAPETP
jgi:hypothetical protein